MNKYRVDWNERTEGLRKRKRVKRGGRKTRRFKINCFRVAATFYLVAEKAKYLFVQDNMTTWFERNQELTRATMMNEK